MRSVAATCLGALISLSGCGTESKPATIDNKFPEWPPEMPLDDVQARAPDECKAILVARAALEARNKSEIHARFRVEKQGGDWWVTADYAPPRGYVNPLGNFSTVVIAPDWSVKRVIGGA